jgi:3-isopropylmalate dehydrogenase
MLLRHSLHLEREAVSVESAVEMSLAQGYRTVDLGGKLKTREMANVIIESVSTD